MVSLSIAENAALMIIEDWGIKEPSEIDVEAIAYEKNIIIYRKPIKGAQARLIVMRPFCSLTVNSNISVAGQRRFAIAHELGHYELHLKDQPIYLINDNDILRFYHDSDIEREANSFASELLMPSFIFEKYCKGQEPSFYLIQEIARAFNTSLTATAFKYVNFSIHPCALIVSEERKIKWKACSEDFPYKNDLIEKNDNLREDTYASDLYTGTKQNQPETNTVNSWLKIPTESNVYIYEHSLFQETYNTVLSLLWVD